MFISRNATSPLTENIHETARLAAGVLGTKRNCDLLDEDELFALCQDSDPTITLLRYLLLTCRDEAGSLRLRSVSQMHARAQELFFTHFDAQKLVDLAADESMADELRAAAVAVLDCCTTGGWRVNHNGNIAQMGTIAGMLVQDQISQGNHKQAARSIRLFAHHALPPVAALAAAS